VDGDGDSDCVQRTTERVAEASGERWDSFKRRLAGRGVVQSGSTRWDQQAGLRPGGMRDYEGTSRPTAHGHHGLTQEGNGGAVCARKPCLRNGVHVEALDAGRLFARPQTGGPVFAGCSAPQQRSRMCEIARTQSLPRCGFCWHSVYLRTGSAGSMAKSAETTADLIAAWAGWHWAGSTVDDLTGTSASDKEGARALADGGGRCPARCPLPAPHPGPHRPSSTLPPASSSGAASHSHCLQRLALPPASSGIAVARRLPPSYCSVADCSRAVRLAVKKRDPPPPIYGQPRSRTGGSPILLRLGAWSPYGVPTLSSQTLPL
ncbi:hypothetical protein BDV95DRAFT_659506, partial [Massariosphaeria phaeospora]